MELLRTCLLFALLSALQGAGLHKLSVNTQRALSAKLWSSPEHLCVYRSAMLCYRPAAFVLTEAIFRVLDWGLSLPFIGRISQ